MKKLFSTILLLITTILWLPAIEQVATEGSAQTSLAASAAPMPLSLPQLTSPAALKAFALRQVTSGSVYVNGGFVSHDGNTGYTVSASTPGKIVTALSQHVFDFSMPIESVGESVYMSGYLHDRFGMTRFFSQNESVPTSNPDGSYSIRQSQKLKMLETQWIEIPGDVVSAAIVHEYEYGSWAEQLIPYSPDSIWINGVMQPHTVGVFIRANSLTADGHFMVVRNELAGDEVKRVTYSYSLKTGERSSAYTGNVSQVVSIENYSEADDSLLPATSTATPQLNLNMAVKQAMQQYENKGVIVEIESQPVCRLDLAYPRTITVSIGLYNTNVVPMQLVEMPKVLQIFQNGKLIKEMSITGNLGQITITLPAGSYDLATPLESFKAFPGVG